MSDRQDLEARRERLSAAKRALLARRLSDAGGAGWRPSDIPRLDEHAAAPLSFAQERLWFEQQWEPDSGTYNRATLLRLEGELDPAPLQRCLSEIVRRHAVLRSAFTAVDGQPVQRVAPAAEVALASADLTGLAREERLASAEGRARALLREPFALDAGSLLRAQLYRLDPADHLLCLVTHHIAFDGQSEALFVRELCALYDACTSGRPAELPELPIQYADYAQWQRAQVGGDRFSAHLAYWREQLAGDLPPEVLLTDRPRPAELSSRGATESLLLPAELVGRAADLGRREGATPFMVLLTAFAALLQRYSGQTDLVLGTMVAGREHPATEHLVGAFANAVVLRTDLSGDPAFRELLARVRHTSLEAYAHQELPFELLVREHSPVHDFSRSPLFQVAFSLEDFAQPRSAGNLTVTPHPLNPDVALFDLSVELTRSGDALRCAFTYNTDLFDAGTIRQLAAHYLILLQGALSDPGRRLSELPLLTEAERRRILVDWNATPALASEARCIHRHFEAQVQRTPLAIAVRWREQSLTYAELERQANRLARYLRGLGVGPEVLVGVCLERNLQVPVALLGILKAGGAYLPLDPAYPHERLAFMLEDAGVGIVLTQGALGGCLPASFAAGGGRLVNLDEDAAWAQESDARLGLQTEPHALAYVLYTSGSTGRPKGVALEHRGVDALIQWSRRVFSPPELAGVLASSSIMFDFSVFELFATLACGGSVILADDLLQLPVLPAAQLVTQINTVASVLAELLRTESLPPSVRTVNLGGEAVSAALADQAYAQPGVSKVYDLYGPTEDTTFSTWALRRPGGPAVIGRSLDGSQAYVLDAAMQPVPVGAPGELYLGGAGLARGYLNRPELTAERFVPNPFSAEAGARLYRTGDLARWRPDGNLAFLGRIDTQVKLHGLRIELGEIEAQLAGHPTVRDCAVAVRKDETGAIGLIAYVVLKAPAAANASVLRPWLQDRLPPHMVPARYVLLEALPHTPNGKLDRKALPAPGPLPADATPAHLAPRTAVEEILAGIWGEVLGKGPVGVHDDFFDLGGHSLLAVRLLARIERALHVRLPLGVFFQAPTIAQVAGLLSERAATTSPTLLPIQPYGTRPPLFVVPPMAMAEDTMGAMYIYRTLARLLGPDQPVFGLQPKGMGGSEAPLRSIEAMAAYYIGLVRDARPQGPYLLAGQCNGGLVAFEMARQLRRLGQEPRLVALLDSQAHNAPRNARGLTPLQRVLRVWKRGRRRFVHYLDGLRGRRWPERARRAPEGGGGLEDAAGRPRSGVLQAFWFAFSHYRPQLYAGSVTLFRAQRHARPRFDEETGGWRALALGGVEIHDVPGEHGAILREPNVQVLAEALSECIARALAEPGAPAEAQ